MTTKTQTVVTCDICGGVIDEKKQAPRRRVDATVYGRDFHEDCLRQVDGTIIGLLVDDVYVHGALDGAGRGSRLLWNRLVPDQALDNDRLL
jgi:hypothetical protein